MGAPRRLLIALSALLALGALPLGAAPAGAKGAASGGQVSACYVASGKHKGAMRIVAAPAKCNHQKGEKPLVWNVAGPTGAQGPPGLSVDTESLLSALEAQDKKIETLTSQVNVLGGELAAVKGTLAAVCTQLTAATSQLNAVRDAVAGLRLNNFLTAVGGLLQIPALPAALSPFACA